MDQVNATNIEKYIANNEGSIVQHLDKQSNWIRVAAGDHLKIMTVGLGLAENLTASRVGDDLVVFYIDGSSVVFIDYFICTIASDPSDDTSCSVTLAGDNEPYVVPAGAGFSSSNAQVIYHQGTPLDSFSVAPVVDSSLAEIGSQIERIAEPALGPAVGLYGVLGGGAALAVAAGSGSSNTQTVSDTTAEEKAAAWNKVTELVQGGEQVTDLSLSDVNRLGLSGMDDLNSRNLLNSSLRVVDDEQITSLEDLSKHAKSVSMLMELVASQDSSKPLSLADIGNIPITGVDTQQELDLLKTVLAEKSPNDVDSIAEIQAITSAVDKLKNTPQAITQTQLEALGITGISSVNLQQIKDKVAEIGAGITNIDSLQAELTKVKNKVTDILAKAVASTHTDHTGPMLTLHEYEYVGFTGVNNNNLAFVHSFWALDTLTAPATVASGENLQLVQKAWFQDHINVINPIYSLMGDSSSTISLDLSGVQALLKGTVTAEQVSLFEEVVKHHSALTKAATAVVVVIDAVQQVSNLADGSVNDPLQISQQLSLVDFKTLGMSAVDTDVKASFMNKALNGREFGLVDTWADLQALNLALEHWFADASLSGVNDPLTVGDIELLGFNSASSTYQVNENNIAAVQKALESLDYSVVSPLQIQDLINTTVGDVHDALDIFIARTKDDTMTSKPNFDLLLDDMALYQASDNEPLLQTLLDQALVTSTWVENWASLQAFVIATDWQQAGVSLGSVANDSEQSLADLMLFADALSLQAIDQMLLADKQNAVAQAAIKAMDLVAADWVDGALPESLTAEQLLDANELSLLGITDATSTEHVSAYNLAIVGLANDQWQNMDSVEELNGLAVI